jgi:hypothetical protein
MVYELLQDCFVLDDFVNGFNFFFEVYGHIFQNRCSTISTMFAFYISTFNVGEVI